MPGYSSLNSWTLLVLLWALAGASAADMPKNHVSLRVFTDGKIEINNFAITAHQGVNIPQAILIAQKAPPIKTHVADRAVWFSFEELGLLVSRRDDPKSEHANIILPAISAEPFNTIVFAGELMLDDVRIEFDPKKPQKRDQILDAIKSIPKECVQQDANSIILFFETTFVDIVFDAANQLQHVSLSLRVP